MLFYNCLIEEAVIENSIDKYLNLENKIFAAELIVS